MPQLKPIWGQQRVKAGESWRRGTEGASYPQGQAGGLWLRSVRISAKPPANYQLVELYSELPTWYFSSVGHLGSPRGRSLGGTEPPPPPHDKAAKTRGRESGTATSVPASP